MLGFIVALAFLLRINQLGQKSFWYDEACSLQFACRDLASIFQDHYLLRPLYFVVLNVWTKIFGIGEHVSRLPSVIFGVISVIIIYKLGKELFDHKTGMIAAFLLAISYYHIAWSQQVRGYSLLALLCTVAALYFIRIIHQNRTSNYFIYAFFSVLAIYTSFAAIAVFIFQMIFLATFCCKQSHDRRWRLAASIVCAAVGILVWLSWIMKGYVQEDMLSARTVIPGAGAIMELLGAFNYGGGYIAQGATAHYAGNALLPCYILLSFILIYFYVYGIFARLNWNKNVFYCLGWLWFTVFLLGMAHFLGLRFFAPKYLIFTLPAYYLLVARGMSVLRNSVFLSSVLVVVFVCNVFSYVSYYKSSDIASWREAAAYLKSNMGATDSIILLPAQQIAPFWLYFKGDQHDFSLTGNGLGGKVKLIEGGWRQEFRDGRNNIYGIPLDGADQFIKKFKNGTSNIWIVASKGWPGLKNYAEFIDYFDQHYTFVERRDFSIDGVEVLFYRATRAGTLF